MPYSCYWHCEKQKQQISLCILRHTMYIFCHHTSNQSMYMSTNTNNIYPVLIKALQELKTPILIKLEDNGTFMMGECDIYSTL